MSDPVDYTKYTTAELTEAQRAIEQALRKASPASLGPPSSAPPEVGDAPRPRTRDLTLVLGIVCTLGILAIVGIWAVVAAVRKTGWFAGADEMFGDQHLKTAVALIELHKTRNGEYPASLRELRFTGQWDEMHIISVSYCVGEDGQSYFVEVSRGFIGKPRLQPRDDFWQGTGYDPALGPCD